MGLVALSGSAASSGHPFLVRLASHFWFFVASTVFLMASSQLSAAQDQQLGARTKAMGGSYTAFEDDPVSVWLNPAGIATQPDQGSITYQTYTVYPLHKSGASGSSPITTSTGPKTSFVDPAFIPSYLGFVFQVGDADLPMALGVCYARPYHLNYSFAKVDDPTLTTFVPDSNTEQSFGRFRVAYALDFRFRGPQEGFLTHVAVGAGVDLGFEHWRFNSDTQSLSDTETSLGGGGGFLICVYDAEAIKVNFGAAYQSAIHWNFSTNPKVAPAFQMPQQINLGTTFYLLKGTPLRLTIDGQWIQWSKTAIDPFFPGQPRFRDAYNASVGVEYRIQVSQKLRLYPRVGYRRFEAPWQDQRDLPMTSNYKLVLNTKASVFNMGTSGVGLSWTTAGGKIHSFDFGADFGGDSPNFALGFNTEF